MSPVAGLSDTLCLTFFSLGVFEVFQLFFCTVTFSKTSGMCLDGNIWQSNGKRFLNYDLSDIVMSDVCQTGQKWAKTAYGANHTLGRLPRAARVPPGVPSEPRGCLTDYRGPGAPCERMCLIYRVWHLRAFKFKGKCELFSLFFISRKIVTVTFWDFLKTCGGDTYPNAKKTACATIHFSPRYRCLTTAGWVAKTEASGVLPGRDGPNRGACDSVHDARSEYK